MSLPTTDAANSAITASSATTLPCPACGEPVAYDSNEAALGVWTYGPGDAELWGGYVARCACGQRLTVEVTVRMRGTER